MYGNYVGYTKSGDKITRIGTEFYKNNNRMTDDELQDEFGSNGNTLSFEEYTNIEIAMSGEDKSEEIRFFDPENGEDVCLI